MGWRVSGGRGQYDTHSPALLRAVLNAMCSDGRQRRSTEASADHSGHPGGSLPAELHV